MVVTIPPQNMPQYLAERSRLLHQRISLTVLLGALLFPLFSILDFVVAREFFTLFFIYRITCSTALIAVFFYNSKTNIAHKVPFSSVILAYCVSSVAISAMIIKLGGYGTGYYMGLILALVICSTILPLSIKQYLICATITYLLYLIPVYLCCDLTTISKSIFISNNFFLISAIIIILYIYYENNKSQALEFNMRMKENSYVERLSSLADNLEDEVQKRTIELETSDHRFRQLYENINDDILLLDQQGAILRANNRFIKRMRIDDKQIKTTAFLSFVHPDDRRHVDKALFAPFSRGEDAKDVDFRLQLPGKEIMYVECNASIIKKGQRVIGSQLLIRDTSERRNLEKELEASFQTEQNARESIILALANLAEYREIKTGANLEKIRSCSRLLAKDLTRIEQYRDYITEDYIETLYHSSILHDIGKVGIPDSVLLKIEKLTKREREIVQEHVIFGGETLKSIEAQTTGQTFLAMGKHIAFFHHERWDGKGYPQGLKGEEIPLSARIVSLVDAYEAMTSPRVYRRAYSHQEALEIIVSERGKQFDPDVVDAFLRSRKDFESIERTHQSSLYDRIV